MCPRHLKNLPKAIQNWIFSIQFPNFVDKSCKLQVGAPFSIPDKFCQRLTMILKRCRPPSSKVTRFLLRWHLSLHIIGHLWLTKLARDLKHHNVFSNEMKDHDPRSCEHNLCNCVKKPEKKKSGLQRDLGSNPVEVLKFFQASLRNYVNCVHNCEDHPSFDFISAARVHI